MVVVWPGTAVVPSLRVVLASRDQGSPFFWMGPPSPTRECHRSDSQPCCDDSFIQLLYQMSTYYVLGTALDARDAVGD